VFWVEYCRLLRIKTEIINPRLANTDSEPENPGKETIDALGGKTIAMNGRHTSLRHF
jgi:hypothetical protein